MDCHAIEPVAEEDLIAYYLGEPIRQEVQEHLRSCLACQMRIFLYQDLEKRLKRELYRYDCPSSLLLGQFQLDSLQTRQKEYIQNHLKHCILCSQDLKILQQILAEDLQIIDPPSQYDYTNPMLLISDESTQPLTERIIASQRRTREQRLDARWPRWYRAGTFHLSIHVTRMHAHGNYWELNGLLMQSQEALQIFMGTPVQLTRLGTERSDEGMHETINERGSFLFLDLEPATYMLEVFLSEHVIVVEQLMIED